MYKVILVTRNYKKNMVEEDLSLFSMILIKKYNSIL